MHARARACAHAGGAEKKNLTVRVGHKRKATGYQIGILKLTKGGVGSRKWPQ